MNAASILLTLSLLLNGGVSVPFTLSLSKGAVVVSFGFAQGRLTTHHERLYYYGFLYN
jgi:hypothetical protein